MHLSALPIHTHPSRQCCAAGPIPLYRWYGSLGGSIHGVYRPSYPGSRVPLYRPPPSPHPGDAADKNRSLHPLTPVLPKTGAARLAATRRDSRNVAVVLMREYRVQRRREGCVERAWRRPWSRRGEIIGWVLVV